jgi:hypothetical protein
MLPASTYGCTAQACASTPPGSVHAISPSISSRSSSMIAGPFALSSISFAVAVGQAFVISRIARFDSLKPMRPRRSNRR